MYKIQSRTLNDGKEGMCTNLQYKSDISNDIYPAMLNDVCLTPCTQVRKHSIKFQSDTFFNLGQLYPVHCKI